jgi:hypothetical protein
VVIQRVENYLMDCVRSGSRALRTLALLALTVAGLLALAVGALVGFMQRAAWVALTKQVKLIASSRELSGAGPATSHDLGGLDMNYVTVLLVSLVIVSSPVITFAGPKEDVAAVAQAWADAFNAHDLERVLSLYDPEAVLWGTVSPTLRDTPASIRDYFKGLPDQPQLKVKLVEQRTRVYGDSGINTGSYTFTNVRDGNPVTIPARFSF